ncbi:putative membrane protein [Sphingomonas jejuensis]|uniref:Membrane protein n=1 Tax=Sphingomonas jejuensis TaxID=904715 RepID=A0ABX0XHZ0_9SPHN|nr:DUF4142 domain-containing protein [Sphingomonas jejuensis]NJC32951.1 putative membrane protein [Sphingomonas jejuensis]
MKAMILAGAALTMLATTLPASASVQAAAPATARAAPSPQTPTTAAAFVPMAGASDLYEIQSSQLALEKSRNEDVRRYAQMMITHHRQTTEQVTAAAREAGLTPRPPVLNPEQRANVAALRRLSGAGFDRTYLTQQVRAHEQALALHSTYADRGDQPALRRAAAGARPIVQQHLDEVRTLSRQR